MPEDMQSANFDEESWRQIEASLRAGLSEEGLPVEQIDWICRDMKPRYLLCCCTGGIVIDAPPEYREAIEDAIERTGAFFGAATARLLVVMAKLEAELYEARFPR